MFATIRFIADVCRRWYHGGIGDLAAGVTFWILVSLPAAALALLAALGPIEGLINVSFRTEMEDELVSFTSRVFTSDSSEGIQEAIRALFDQTNSGLLTASLAVALFSISRGFAGLIRVLEDIYNVVDGRPWYRTRVMALVLGVGSLLISVPLVIMERLVWEPFPDGPAESVLRFAAALVLLAGWASTIYHFGPATRTRWRHDLPGAVTAAVLWWLMTIGYRLYVELTAEANGVTAAVGAGLLGLTWLWLAAQVLLIGGTVNFLLGERLGFSNNQREWSVNDRIGRITDQNRKITDADLGPAPDASLGPDARTEADAMRRSQPKSKADPKSRRKPKSEPPPEAESAVEQVVGRDELAG